jgi:FKBP-type peptidyl-prolyl cis-trans isomerase
MRPTSALLAALAAAAGTLAACSMLVPCEVPRAPVELGDNLVIQDLVIPPGEPVAAGAQVEVHYACQLEDGREVDSSYARGQTLHFRLGSGAVSAGFDRGIVGMRPGGRRRIFVPPELGYGARGLPGLIPPDAALVYDVELIAVAP